MTSSFANADQPTVTDVEATESRAAAHANTLVVVPRGEIVPDSFFQNEGVEGSFDRDDAKMPSMSVVQGVGPLSAIFAPGTIVYAKETPIGNLVKLPTGVVEGTDGIFATLVHLKKYLVEDLPYDPDGPIPRRFNGVSAMEDARAAGYLPSADKYQNPGHQYVKPVAEADFLIRGNASNVTFPFDFEGTPYALARWVLQGTGWTRVAKQLYTDTLLALRGGLTTKFYTISAKRTQIGANLVYAPKATLTGVNTPEFIEWAKTASL